MAENEHPNLARLRGARRALDMSTRYFQAEIVRTMNERQSPDHKRRYTSMQVAQAASISRPRVYQILNEARAA